ncbi:uncharacterized protein LOC109794015 isoform X2 [Cajanus cajan]|nr:uncharacterized protein LOC109794015 isoform X2 [Cajanus cajan]
MQSFCAMMVPFCHLQLMFEQSWPQGSKVKQYDTFEIVAVKIARLRVLRFVKDFPNFLWREVCSLQFLHFFFVYCYMEVEGLGRLLWNFNHGLIFEACKDNLKKLQLSYLGSLSYCPKAYW